MTQCNFKPHTCESSLEPQKAKPVLTGEVRLAIRQLYIAQIRKPLQILASLREQNRIERLYDQEPTSNQIKHQCQVLRKEFLGSGEISLGALEEFLKANSLIPEDEDEPFVIGFDVRYKAPSADSSSCEDEPKSDDSGFWFQVATKRTIRVAYKRPLICADGTYKLLWQGFAGLLFGTVDSQNQFHSISFGVSSSERTEDYSGAFKVNHVIDFFLYFQQVARLDHNKYCSF